MLATLQIEFENNNEKIKYSYGSLFHGLLMEYLDSDYVDFLHNQELNPYSQYVFLDKEKNNYVWQISTLTKASKINIIDKLTENLGNSIKLTHNNIELKIKSKKIVNIQTYKEFADKIFLQEDRKNIINIKLLTPTTYKSNGEYQMFPQVSALYYSAYNKWNMFSDEISLADEEVFRHIIDYSKIIKYNLKSYKYGLEKVALNSFIGDMTILLKGPKELALINNLLLEYAKYCGLGAKTSIGMGGVGIG